MKFIRNSVWWHVQSNAMGVVNAGKTLSIKQDSTSSTRSGHALRVIRACHPNRGKSESTMGKEWGERLLSHVDLHFLVVIIAMTLFATCRIPLHNLSREIEAAALVGMGVSGFCTVVSPIVWVPWEKGLRKSLLHIIMNFGAGSFLGFLMFFLLRLPFVLIFK